MTVYVDEIFAVNMIMDWLILQTVGSLAQCGRNILRLTVASFLGAAYSIAIILCGIDFLRAVPVKIGYSVLMILIAYPFISFHQTGRLMAWFYLVSFVLGGASMAAMYLFGQPYMQTWSGIALIEIDFHLFWLAAGFGLTIIFAGMLRGRLLQDVTMKRQIVTACIRFDNRSVEIPLLADTGHCLTDPLSGKSILIAEQNKLIPLFPVTVQQLLQMHDVCCADMFIKLSEHKEMNGRWRLIPYQTVGSQDIMLGFKADSVTLLYNKGKRVYRDILIGMQQHRFSGCESFQGLVPPELL